MDAKDAMIIAQVAAKAAATIHSGTGDTTGYAATFELIHDDLLSRITKGATETVTATSGVANVTAAFPGATGQPAPAPVAAPVASSGNDQEDAAWADLLANPGNWYNNIPDGGTSYTGGSKPDFRHKTAVNAKGDKYALWLVSRRFGRTAPEHVFQALGLTNPGATAPVAPATSAFPQSPKPAGDPF